MVHNINTRCLQIVTLSIATLVLPVFFFFQLFIDPWQFLLSYFGVLSSSQTSHRETELSTFISGHSVVEHG